MDELNKLKEWLLNQISYICKDDYNESTYMWSKVFKKSCLETLDQIKKIQKEDE